MPEQKHLMATGVPWAQAQMIGKVTATPAGAGTTGATGTALQSNSINTATSLTAASAEAFLLPAPLPGDLVYFSNQHGTAAAKIFPQATHKIAPGGGAAVGANGAVYSLAALKNALFVADSTGTSWFVIVT